MLHLLPSLLLGSLEVFDSLAEAGILEGGCLGDGIIEAVDGSGEGLVVVLAVVGHLNLHCRELLIG